MPARARSAGSRAEDDRIDAALHYAGTIACPWPAQTGASFDNVVPAGVSGTPRDDATARFDRELRAAWSRDRALLIAGLPSCHGRAGRWTLARDERSPATAPDGHGGELGSVPVRSTGRPAWRPCALGSRRSSCAPSARAPGCAGRAGVTLSQDLIAALRAPVRAVRTARVRVVGEAMGVAASISASWSPGRGSCGCARVRRRSSCDQLSPGVTPASRVAVAGDVVLELRATPRGVMLHGGAELFVAEPGPPPAWRRMAHGPDVLLDRVTLIAAGSPEHRRVALFRPPREWAGSPPVVDMLLADDTSSVGDRSRRAYPYGAALPELGWVNPFDVERSLGLDGWIHAALHAPSAAGPACGTLAPPAIARDRVCSPSPLDGVTECRVALQPELAARLHAIARADRRRSEAAHRPRRHAGAGRVRRAAR